ncbi:MAG: hypothetical protein AB8U44_03265 [Aaplasma endosymbiont of Hyalomma asiaticum]
MAKVGLDGAYLCDIFIFWLLLLVSKVLRQEIQPSLVKFIVEQHGPKEEFSMLSLTLIRGI